MKNLNLQNLNLNEEIKKHLQSAFSQNRLPHAIILEGSLQRNKLGETLAKAAVCTTPQTRPCGSCSGCIKANCGSHPDIIKIDGDENPSAFKIDVIRQIRIGAYIKPNEAENKVYLLLGVHNMSEISQNALLKVFEEPPANVLFILTAQSASSLLSTVRSRAQIFTLEEKFELDESDIDYLTKLTSAITAVNGADLLFLTSELAGDRERLKNILSELSLVLRDAAVLRCGGESVLSGQKEAALKLGSSLTRNKLAALLSEVKKAQQALDQNANLNLLVTALCANLRAAAGR